MRYLYVSDCRDLFKHWLITLQVTGNVVDGKPIAGLIQVSQFLLKGGSGIIESINGAAGSIKIVGGPTIKINDPSGVYGAKYTGLSSFYRADDENPSVSSFSGFPMCIQRDAFDTKCPSSNRPAGQRTLYVRETSSRLIYLTDTLQQST